MLQSIFDEVINIAGPNTRDRLLALKNHPNMGRGAKLVYVYSLADPGPYINYPKKPGAVIYIGETNRTGTPAGIRFGMHLSKAATEGTTTNINYALSHYYYSGRALRLVVHRVTTEDSTNAVEQLLLKAHLREFGATPIGQGATGKCNSPGEIERFALENPDVYAACVNVLIIASSR